MRNFSRFRARPERSIQCPETKQTRDALRAARKLFAHNPDFLEVSPDNTTKTLLLKFAFPRSAQRQHELLRRLRIRTGWRVRVQSRTNQQRIHEIAKEMPLTWDLTKVSIYAKESRVKLRIRFAENTPDADVERFVRRFETRSGLTLELQEVEPRGKPQALFDPRGRMEQNAAFRLIKDAYIRESILPPKCSLRCSGEDEEWISLRFVTPLLGEFDPQLLEDLSHRVGRELRVRPSADPAALYRLVSWLADLDWGLSGKHQLRANEELFRVECLGRPHLAHVDAVCEEFLAQTGYRLEVVDG